MSKAKVKGRVRAVVLNADGTVKQDYGVVATQHPNRFINWVYAQIHVLKRAMQFLRRKAWPKYLRTRD